MSALTLLLCLGASLRLFRLWANDDVAAGFREFVFKQVDRVKNEARNEKIFTWLTCRWCLGFWICAAVTATGAAWGDHLWWQTVAGALAISYALAHVDTRLEEGLDRI